VYLEPTKLQQPPRYSDPTDHGPLDVEAPAVRYVSLGSFRSPSPLTSVQALDINVSRWPERVTDMVIRIKNVVDSLYFVHLLHMCLRR
jgi:hypothetical protein